MLAQKIKNIILSTASNKSECFLKEEVVRNDNKLVVRLDNKLLTDIIMKSRQNSDIKFNRFLIGEQPIRTEWFACFFNAGSSLKTE
jgi:hypothetical protein